MINLDDLINSIAEATAESIRNYEIYKSIEEIRTETNSRIIEIMEG